jgi:DNA-binding GntR family transcriptional regulator
VGGDLHWRGNGRSEEVAAISATPTLSVNRSSPVPLYFQVAEQLERAIVEGGLHPGDKITNEITLADQLGLSRPTMRQAIQTLVDKGLLVRKRGVGTQVVQSPIRQPVELTSLSGDRTATSRTPHTRVLRLDRGEVDSETAAQLQLVSGAVVWRLDRLRLVGGEPLALLSNVVPVDVVDLEAADLSATGLYDHFRRCGLQIRVAHQSIGARRATAREARLLGISRGDPLVTMRRIAFDDSGRAVELGSHAYRPDLYSFEITLVDR